MNKKYELIKEDKIDICDAILYRIKALKDFNDVEAGDYGGYIEKEENLSHDGNAWVYNDAEVYGDARVYDNAKVYNGAKVYDNAEVYGDAGIYDNAEIYENAKVYDNAEICDDAWVYGDAEVHGNARVYCNAWVSDDAIVYGNAEVYDNVTLCGDAEVYNNAKVCGDAKVFGDAEIKTSNDYIMISNMGSRLNIITFAKSKNNNILVKAECFEGYIDEFENVIKEFHSDNEYAQAYNLTIQLAKLRIKL